MAGMAGFTSFQEPNFWMDPTASLEGYTSLFSKLAERVQGRRREAPRIPKMLKAPETACFKDTA